MDGSHRNAPGSRTTRRALAGVGALTVLALGAVAPAAAAEAGHAVDAVDLVTGAEDPAAVVAFALEGLQVLAGLIGIASLRSVIGRFEGGAIVRGLVVMEGGVALLLVSRAAHLATVVAPVRPVPPVVGGAFVLAALLCFAAASVDLYRAL